MSNNGWSNQTGSRLVLVVGSVFSGIFFYDPTIGAGNLITSLVPAAGTDPYGNTYAQGLTIGKAGGDQIVMGLTGGQPLLYFPTGASGITNASAIQTIRQAGSGVSGYDQLQVLGAQNTAQNDSVLTAWAASSTDGTNLAQILEFYHDSGGVYNLYRLLNKFGPAYLKGLTLGASPTVLPVQGELFMANAAAAPATPTGGGALYAQNGVPHWKDSGGLVSSTVRSYAARATGLLSNFTAEADIPGATVNVTITGSNATILVNAAWDMNAGGAATTFVGFFNWNGADQTAQGIKTASAANQRDTVHQNYQITGIAAGTYTAKLRASCTVANNLNQVGGSHTGFTVLVIDQ